MDPNFDVHGRVLERGHLYIDWSVPVPFYFCSTDTSGQNIRNLSFDMEDGD